MNKEYDERRMNVEYWLQPPYFIHVAEWDNESAIIDIHEINAMILNTVQCIKLLTHAIKTTDRLIMKDNMKAYIWASSNLMYLLMRRKYLFICD